jgi:cbb3-type cytochrome oxidase subunit 3
MNFWVHLIVVILFTAYFIFRFVKDKYIYEILFVIWIPSTLLSYVTDNRAFLLGLGIFQTIMFILVIYFMFRKRGDRRTKTLQMLAEMAADRLPDEQESQERPQELETENKE